MKIYEQEKKAYIKALRPYPFLIIIGEVLDKRAGLGYTLFCL
jgi:hypothetical protein